MSNFLAKMAKASHERVEHAKRLIPMEEMRRRAVSRPTRRRLTLHATGFDIIAEIKRHAPSTGALDTTTGDAALAKVAVQSDAYTRGGAAAISVLTEPTAFSGTLDDLGAAATSTQVPVMRKDFLVDEYQVFEARAHDASGVLLIAALLQREKIESFLLAAEQTEQFILLEVFSKEEMRTVDAVVHAASGRDISLLVGVNARNLATLEVETDRFATLAPYLPTNVPLVAESGLESVADVRDAAMLGYRVALVGTAFMRSTTPGKTVSQFVDAGRQAARACASE